MLELGHARLREQHEAVALQVVIDPDVTAVLELAEQELLGERTLDVLLNDACHRPRAHALVVALRGDPVPRRRLELDRDVVLLELRLELEHELVDDARDRFVVERLELNVLLAPHEGLTASTERLTALIKRIGGFRIGSLPSFGAAAAAGQGDPIDGLRKLAPYAGAIHATIEGFTKKGTHKSWDLKACVTAIRSVGFLNTLAIDYTGEGDPIPNIEKARDLLQTAIDAEDN